MGQIREVIRIRLVSVHDAPDTSRHLMSVCQAASTLEETVGVLCTEAALRAQSLLAHSQASVALHALGVP